MHSLTSWFLIRHFLSSLSIPEVSSATVQFSDVEDCIHVHLTHTALHLLPDWAEFAFSFCSGRPRHTLYGMAEVVVHARQESSFHFEILNLSQIISIPAHLVVFM